jgi:hypothetical protein
MYYKTLSSHWYNKTRFVDDVLVILSTRFKQYFNHPIYAISLIVSPQYRDFAISKYYSYNYILKEII